MSEWKVIPASRQAQNTSNPIRKIVDQMKGESKCTKPMISLSIGDPTTDGNLLPPVNAEDTLIANIKTRKFNGYPPSVGYPGSREAVARYWVKNFAPNSTTHGITADKVILGSGASHSLLMAITAICNPGDTLLIPAPCFSLYGTICDSYGIHVSHYQCLPDRDWEIDLEDLKSKITPSVKAVLINNPSNPCGSNFKKSHVEDILAVADAAKVPIIADEIYAGLVFTGNVFTSVADIDTDVPRIVVGGLAKTYVVPGWRLGWSIQVDPKGYLANIQAGMVALSTLLVGPNSLIQSAMDQILNHTDAQYAVTLAKDLETSAHTAFDILKTCAGLVPTTPQGAMYMMVKVDTSKFKDIANGIEFAKKLQEEQNVQVLPGEIFVCPGFFRIVVSKEASTIAEAGARIKEFCEAHTL